MTKETENWIKCPAPAVGDLLRWDEPLFAPPDKKRGKPTKMGDQRVTAELLADGEFYVLYVIEAIKTGGSGTIKVKSGDEIRRKPTSIAMGNPYKKAN